MGNSRSALWHVLAVATVAVWGGSFVSTRILLSSGFTPTQIFLLRFVLAYGVLLACSHRRLFADTKRHEFLLALCGLFAGTLYFLAENTALEYSPVSNVSLIVCANPLFTMIFAGLLFRGERLGKRQVLGSLITLCGMATVVLNGKFVLRISPVGDLLAFLAALSWTFYSLIVRPLSLRYSALFITRKIFLYGALSSFPVLFFTGADIPWKAFAEPRVLGNFLFLGIVASLFGYVVWNRVLKSIGTVLASNYIYAVPLFSIAISVAVLRERITVATIVGAALVLGGMFLAEYGFGKKSP